MDMHPDAKSLIDDYTREAARRSGLPEPARSEGRIELQSHLVESAAAKAKDDGDGQVMRSHAREAIAALGNQADVDAAFFAGHRTDGQEAGWGRRWGAILIDFLIVGILMVPVAMVSLSEYLSDNVCDTPGLTKCEQAVVASGPCFSFSVFNRFEGDPDAVAEANREANDVEPVACAGFIIVTLGYFVILEATLGRTVGKMAVGTRVVRNDGTPMHLGQALGRNVVKLLLPFLLLDWFIGMLTFKPARLRLSDKAAGTRVVLTR
ncbi:MAG: RDD family protein [Candidatus Thermoplasmatota archaeon]